MPEDYNDTFWNNPRAAMQAEIELDRRRQQFWDGFYQTHDRLRPHAELVETVLAERFEEIGQLPTAEASAKLADRVRERIAEKSGRRRPGQLSEHDVMRGGPGDEVAAADDDGGSIAEVLRLRRASQHEAERRLRYRGHERADASA